MNENNKIVKVVIAITSLTTLGIISYKVLKKKYPNKLNNFSKYVKNNLLSFKEDNTKQTHTNIDKNSFNFEKTIDTNNISNINNSNTHNDQNDNDDIDKSNTLIEEKTKEDIQKHLDNIIQDNEKELIIPDNYIEDEIRYQLCLSNKESITKDILKNLVRIDFFEIDDNDIKIYCDFLNKYTNIKSIVIDSLNPLKYNGNINEYKSTHSLKDISPINKLQSLEELSFNWGIENIDFSSLCSLPNLKKLEIKFGMINNIDFITNFNNLEHLEIMLSNNIKDISCLTKLSKLNRLYIYTNTKIDTTCLKDMKSLEHIYINGESIKH